MSLTPRTRRRGEIAARLPKRVWLFVDEKFPEDKLQRRLIALAFIVGPILYFAN